MSADLRKATHGWKPDPSSSSPSFSAGETQKDRRWGSGFHRERSFREEAIEQNRIFLDLNGFWIWIFTLQTGHDRPTGPASRRVSGRPRFLTDRSRHQIGAVRWTHFLNHRKVKERQLYVLLHQFSSFNANFEGVASHKIKLLSRFAAESRVTLQFYSKLRKTTFWFTCWTLHSVSSRPFRTTEQNGFLLKILSPFSFCLLLLTFFVIAIDEGLEERLKNQGVREPQI